MLRLSGYYSSTSLSALVLGAMLSSPAFCAPDGGVVTHGQADISAPAEGHVVINQHTNKAVINWNNFDNNAGEHTEFRQPSRNAATLNRITNNAPTSIDGKLTANGNVVVVNPNGIVFGRNAKVDVGGLVASTADIADKNFMQGTLGFDRPGAPDAAIINHGSITAKDAGLVGLVAPNVENHGVITANLGRVQLASGDTATVDLHGDGLIEIAVTDKVQSQLVVNTGSIKAEGGTIALTAAAGGDIVNSLIHAEGELLAPSIQQQNGKIIITGKDSDITIDGHLAASGAQKAGNITIGGDFQGKGNTPTARTTNVSTQSIIAANSEQSGDGGEIIIWSDNDTKIDGTIEAKGAASGKGGFVETSGKETLTVSENATVDTGGGTWLLDPTDITINNSGAANTVSAATITTGLSTGNVVIHTGNAGSDAGDITINENIVYNSTHDLSLLAHRHINANANVQNGSDGDVNLIAGWNGTTGYTPGAAGYASPSNIILNASDANGILNSANNAYGNNNGAVNINNSANNESVAVGSQNGSTTVAGYNINIVAGNTVSDYAQIGNTNNSNGDIKVHATQDVVIQGGTTGNDQYAKIGHGTHGTNQNLAGNITVTAGNDIIITDGILDRSDAQIGHGGFNSAGNKSGNIDIEATRDVSLTQRGSHDTGAKIGHDGITAATSFNTVSGNINVAARDITMSGVDSGSSAKIVQIGNGNRFSSGSVSGNINITTTRNLNMNNGQMVQIGHGSSQGFGSGTRQGNITVNVGNELSLTGSNPNSGYIGHKSSSGTSAVTNANVRLQADALDFSAATTNTFNINNTNFISRLKDAMKGGDVIIASTGTNGLTWSNNLEIADSDDITSNLTLLSARDINMNASIEHKERNLVADGSSTNAQVNLIAGWDGSTGFSNATDTTFDVTTIRANTNSFGNNNGSANINNASASQAVIVGSHDGETNVAGYDVTLQAGDNNAEFAHIGAVVTGNNQTRTGNIRVDAKNDITMNGTLNNGYTMIGHGTDRCLGGCAQINNASLSGDVTVNGGNNLTMQGGNFRAFSLIGHGGRHFRGSMNGDINVSIQNDIVMDAERESFRTIGHGGFQPFNSNASGDIHVSANNITMQGNIHTFSFVNIGHGSSSFSLNNGDKQGNVSVTAQGELSVISGSGSDATADIGHKTFGNISNSNTRILAGALDYSAATTGTFNLNNTDFKNRTLGLLSAGDITIGSTSAALTLSNGLDWNSTSDNTLSFLSSGNLVLENTIDHTGTNRTLNLVSGWDGTSGLNNDATISLSAINVTNNNHVLRSLGAGTVTSDILNVKSGGNIGISASPTQFTADTINLDAQGVMFSHVTTDALDIGNNSTGVTLTGLVDSGDDQAAADKITGGPGNNTNYRFENHIIRYVAPAPAPSSASKPSSPVAPAVTPPPAAQPEAPDPTLPTPATPPSSAPTQPQPVQAVNIPNTVQIVSQQPLDFQPAQPEGKVNTTSEQQNDRIIYVADDSNTSLKSKGKIFIDKALSKMLNLSDDMFQ